MKIAISFIDPETQGKTFLQWFTLIICLTVLSIILVGFFLSVCYGEESLKASWYSRASLIKEGTWKYGERMMANGKQFDEEAFTCATRLYRLGTMLRITNRDNGKSVVVKVTDRIGKRFAKTRIDLTPIAFKCISGSQGLKIGLLSVKVEKL